MDIPTMKTRWLSITVLLLFFGSSCTPAIRQGVQETDTQTAVISTNTPLSTPTPTFTQTSTLTPTITPTPIFVSGEYTGVGGSPDGRYLSVSTTLGAFLYDAKSMAPVLAVPSQSSPSMVFSDNSHFFAIESGEKIYIYDLTTLKQVFSIPPAIKASEIKFLPDNDSIAACLSNGTVALYSIREQKLISTLGSAEEKEGSCKLLVSADGSTLAWWSTSKVHLWNLLDNTPGKTFDFQYSPSYLFRDGSALAFTYYQANINFVFIELRDTKTGTRIFTIEVGPDGGFSFFSQFSDLLAEAGESSIPGHSACSGQIKIWRLSDHKLIQTLKMSEGYSLITFSPDGTQIAASLSLWQGCHLSVEQVQKQYIKVWDIETGELIGEHIAPLNPEDTVEIKAFNIWGLYFSADGRIAGFTRPWDSKKTSQFFLWNKFGEMPVQPIIKK